MKIFESKKTTAVWGTPQPRQLLEIFSYLNANGFIGPTEASNLYSFVFKCPIDEDLEFGCVVNRVYEEPENVFNFEAHLSLHSKTLLPIMRKIEQHRIDFIDPKQYAVCIFSVALAHLKWNATQSDENPVWQISQLSGYESSAASWILDWEKYAVPIIKSIGDLPSAIEFCKQIQFYRKNSWVKSDGIGSAALETFLAIMMVKNKQIDDAKELITAALEATNRTAKKIQLKSTSDWIASNELMGSELMGSDEH